MKRRIRAGTWTKKELNTAIKKAEGNVRSWKIDLQEASASLQYAEDEYDECFERVEVGKKFLRCLREKLKKQK